MTEEALREIEERAAVAGIGRAELTSEQDDIIHDDVPTLIAEIRRLQRELEAATSYEREANRNL